MASTTGRHSWTARRWLDSKIDQCRVRWVPANRLDGFLDSHEIEPELLRTDDFDGFLHNRGRRLLNLIEKATGKQVAGRDSEETVQAFGRALV